MTKENLQIFEEQQKAAEPRHGVRAARNNAEPERVGACAECQAKSMEKAVYDEARLGWNSAFDWD